MNDIVFEDKSRFFNSVANGHYSSDIKNFKEVIGIKDDVQHTGISKRGGEKEKRTGNTTI